MANQILPLSRSELLILTALSGREHYGLEIAESVRQLTDGKQTISLGGLYTILSRMERKGLVRGRWGDTAEGRHGARRRYYELSGLGARALSDTRALLQGAWKRAPRLRSSLEGA